MIYKDSKISSYKTKNNTKLNIYVDIYLGDGVLRIGTPKDHNFLEAAGHDGALPN